MIYSLYNLVRPGTDALRLNRDAACAAPLRTSSSSSSQPYAVASKIDSNAGQCTQLNNEYSAAVQQAIKRLMYVGIGATVLLGVGTVVVVKRRRKG